MSTRITFGQWLKATREGQGYSQGELADLVGMKRTYVNAIENNPKWPKPETRDRFHRVFDTSDEDLVRAGAATRREYPRPSGAPRVVYEPTVRKGDQASREPVPAVPPLQDALDRLHERYDKYLTRLDDDDLDYLDRYLPWRAEQAEAKRARQQHPPPRPSSEETSSLPDIGREV